MHINKGNALRTQRKRTNKAYFHTYITALVPLLITTQVNLCCLMSTCSDWWMCPLLRSKLRVLTDVWAMHAQTNVIPHPHQLNMLN